MYRSPRAVLLLVAISGVLAPGALGAQALSCTRQAGAGEAFLSSSYYSTRVAFDAARARDPFDHRGQFTKYEVNPYVEYGLSDDLTLVGNLFLSRVGFSNEFGQVANIGLGAAEVGARYALHRSVARATSLCAVQVVVKLPTEQEGDPALGYDQVDVEARVIALRGFQAAQRDGFWSAEAGYRHRTGAPADELRLDSSVGQALTPEWTILGQFSAIRGLRNESGGEAGGSPVVAPDYDLYRAQLGLLYSIRPGVRLQLGLYRHVYGRNTGAGGGGLASFWIRF